MKGSVRVGGAVVAGIIVILGALYVRANEQQSASDVIVVSPAPVRSFIKDTDSDGDGIKDWKEDLQANIFEAIELETSSSSTSTDPYTPPTTLTGKFSEAFLQEYLEQKMALGDPEATFTDDQKVALVQDAVKAVEVNTKSRRYTQLDIVTVDDSGEALHDYGNRITEIFRAQPASASGKNEAVILQEALQTNDASRLTELDDIKSKYRTIITQTLLVETPRSLVRAHIDLLNAYEAVYTDVSAMRISFEDPLLALARINNYQDNAVALALSLKQMADIITANNISYDSDESGAYLYLFTQ